MDGATAFRFIVYWAVLTALAAPLGRYMARVYAGDIPFPFRACVPFERFLYRICGIRPEVEMTWKRYAGALLAFNGFGALLVYLGVRVQDWVPSGGAAVTGPDSLTAFNIAVSFVTNTNWQAYAGETALRGSTQMLFLAVQNFLSASTGMAVAVVLVRGFVRRSSDVLGNFWVDLTRGVFYILLPLAVATSLALVSQGVVQTFTDRATVHPLDSTASAPSAVSLPLGPAASQIAIKQLGTNGGGYFNANSAHPFENPTPISNAIELLAVGLIPAACAFLFGAMSHSRRHGWMLYGAMTAIALPLAVADISAECAGNPMLSLTGIDVSAGNMEGKEVRIGAAGSALWAAMTTATSNGSVCSSHDSNTPLGGLVPMVLMQLGEVAYGGVGSGLYGMLMFAVIAVFVGGLMVGRTPEFLGKKLGAREMKMASLAVLVPAVAVLIGTAVACMLPSGSAACGNPGPHGFSEMLYAFSSAANNNGSAFAGLDASAPFYVIAIGLCMFAGRFWVIVPVLAVAGSLVGKRRTPATAGTLATDTPLFLALLVATVVLVGALAFLPALALGPLVEHLGMHP